MAHLHEVRDMDTHFVIDPITRTITNPNSDKNKLMQGDHNSEIYTFEIPKVVEGHDMSLCNKVRIHYNDISADKADQSKDVYEVSDLQIDETETEMLVFSWRISGNATKFAGILSFRIQFLCLEYDNRISYAWHTDIFKDIIISDGFDNAEAVVEQYADVLEAWKQELEALQSTEAIRAAVNEYMEQNPYTETDPTVPAWAKQPEKPAYTAEEVGAIPNPAAAEVGQAIKVSAVDENGKPTAWEAVDFPSGGAYRLIRRVELTEDVVQIEVTEDDGGNPFLCSDFVVKAKIAPGTASGAVFWYNNKAYGHAYGGNTNTDGSIKYSTFLWNSVTGFIMRCGPQPYANMYGSDSHTYGGAPGIPINEFTLKPPHGSDTTAAGTVIEIYGR